MGQAENLSESNDCPMQRAELLLIKAPFIETSATVHYVYDYFNANQAISSVPVVDPDTMIPFGIINRSIFMGDMAKPYYRELYDKRSCLIFTDKNPLTVEVGLPLHELSLLISKFHDKVFSDGFIFTEDGSYAGVGYAHDVLRLMAAMHKNQADRLVEHRESLERLVLERTSDLTAAKDAAEAAARAKSSFLANMSHEIRTPMNAILGMAYLIKKGELNPKQHAQLGKIENAAKHLLALINDILDLSKIGAGEMQLSETPFRLATMTQQVIDMIDPLARSKGLVLDLDIADYQGWLVGDAVRITQALINLVGNAVKFTETGSVSLKSRIDDNVTSVTVRFEIRDSGIGIAAEDLPRLFVPFQQADESTTRKFGGTGLGLSITRHLVELMGGEVGAESELGHGSLFWLTIPLKKEPAKPLCNRLGRLGQPTPATLATEQQFSHFLGLKVLLAEDEPINQEIIQDFLHDVGLSVDIAQNGQQALDMLTNKTYDLILMDLQMPEMGGLAASRRIRNTLLLKDIPIIAVTANAFAEDRDRCIEAGMNGFITKPFDPEVFYSTIHTHLMQAQR